MRKLLLVLASVLAATAARAEWVQCGTGAAISGLYLGQILDNGSVLREACHTYTGTTEPSNLGISRCYSVDVFFFAGTSATGYARVCPTAATAVASCKKVLVDQDGGGITSADDVPMDGDDGSVAAQNFAIYGASGLYLAWDAVGSAGTSTTVAVKCNLTDTKR